MAFSALKAHYTSSGLDAICGALSNSPDSGIFMGAACRKESPAPLHTLLFYATYACGDACPAGVCGMKVLAHVREAGAPLVSQVYQNNAVAPSITVGVAAGRRRLHAAGGATYTKVACPDDCPACSCPNDKAYSGAWLSLSSVFWGSREGIYPPELLPFPGSATITWVCRPRGRDKRQAAQGVCTGARGAVGNHKCSGITGD